MPRDEFPCLKCSKPFEFTMCISERERTKSICPSCRGTKVPPQLGGFIVQTARKS